MSVLGKIAKVGAGAVGGFLGGGGIGGAVKGGLDAAAGTSDTTPMAKMVGAGRKAMMSGMPGMDLPGQGGINGELDTKVIKKRRSLSGGRSLSGR